MAEETVEQAAPQPQDRATGAQPLPPLGVSGVVLSKAQLMDALRAYLPNIVDFTPLADGEHFSILFGQDGETRPA